MSWTTSDGHTGDRDTRRPDGDILIPGGVGRVGRDELVAFHMAMDDTEFMRPYGYAMRHDGIHVEHIELGDGANHVAHIGRSLQEDAEVWEWRRKNRTIMMPGNHDDIPDASVLGYCGCNCIVRNDCLLTHGRQFDGWWKKRNGGLGTRIRLGLGHEAIALAEWVPDRWDDRAMNAAHNFRDILAPRGARLDRERFARDAASLAREWGCDVAVTGHLHELWWVKVDGILAVCLGSWVPGGPWPGRFRAGVFDTERRQLWEWRNGTLIDVPMGWPQAA